MTLFSLISGSSTQQRQQDVDCGDIDHAVPRAARSGRFHVLLPAKGPVQIFLFKQFLRATWFYARDRISTSTLLHSTDYQNGR